MATLAQFADNMRKKGEGIRTGATRLQRLTAGAILNAVVMATPVGNPSIWKSGHAYPGYVGGRARGNWQVSLGREATGVVDTPDKSGSTTIHKGQGLIESSVPGMSIHLTNNVAYIRPLNDGHSKQAPVGFIEEAVRVGRNAAQASKVVPK